MKHSVRETMSFLMHLIKPLQKYMLAGIIAGTLDSLCTAMLTVTAGYGILQIIGYRKNMSLVWICFALGGLALIKVFLHSAESACDKRVAQKTPTLIDHAKETGLPEDFFARTVKPVWKAVIFTLIVLIMMARCNAMLALLAMASYLAIGAALPLITNAESYEVHQEVQEETEKLDRILLNEDSSPDMIEETTEELLETREEQKSLEGRSEAAVSLMSSAFAIMMIVAAIVLYWQGVLHYDGVLIAVLLFMSSFGPVSALARTVEVLQDTVAAGNRLMDIQEEEETI